MMICRNQSKVVGNRNSQEGNERVYDGSSKQPTSSLQYLRLPDLFTLASLISAILSIYFSISSRPNLAMVIILVSTVLDGIDGIVARSIGRTDSFGKELDSLADLIAFGITLSVFWLIYGSHSPVDLVAIVIYSVSHAVRLASLNIKISGQPNYGVPDAYLALIFVMFYFMGLQILFPELFLIAAVLMIIPVRVPKIRILLDKGKLQLLIE